jgi:hypothetical protein
MISTPAIFAPAVDISDLLKPQPGDIHPSSGLCRVIEHLVFLEINKLAALYSLPLLDDVDEERYLRSLAPFLRAVKSGWTPQNPRPLADELRKVRAGIREFERWRRKPTEEELLEVVCGALGQDKPVPVTGGEVQARALVTAPPRNLLPQAPARAERPVWLEEFAAVVEGNELLAKTAIRPLLNMSDDAARRAILMMKAGKESKRAGDSEILQQQRASTERRKARTDFVGSLLAEVKAMNDKGDFGDGSALKADWGMPGFVCMGRFDEGDNDVLGYAPGRIFKPTGVPGRVTGWVPVEEYRAYLIGLGDDGKGLLERFDAEHGLRVAAA